MVHLFTAPHKGFEINHGGNIYTLEIGKQYKSVLLLFSWRAGS